MTKAPADRPPGVGTSPRHPERRRAGAMPKIAMITFFIGSMAILADIALFASGARDLPLWLNLACLLAPIGLGIGLVGVVIESRRSAAAAQARAAESSS